MAISPCSDFRAPPPSPIASGRRSCVTNEDVLSQFLEQSLRVPDLILPDRLFPKQSSLTHSLPQIDLRSLHSSAAEVRESVATLGCLEVVNHGIPAEWIGSAMAAAAELFKSVPAEKRAVVKRSAEKAYGFEEEEGAGEEAEFVWSSYDKGLRSEMEGIWPLGYPQLSEKLENIWSCIEKIAEKIVPIILGEERMLGSMTETGEVEGRVCCVYKHKAATRLIGEEENDGRGQEQAQQQVTINSRYDQVIRTLIRGIGYSHALCFLILTQAQGCTSHSHFFVYTKKGCHSFRPKPHALILTIGDQIQAWSTGDYKQVMGRAAYTSGPGEDEKQDFISIAFLYSHPPPPRATVTPNTAHLPQQQQKTITLAQQATLVLLATLFYYLFAYMIVSRSRWPF